MPTTTWNITTIDGTEYLVIETAQFRVPLDWDPSSSMFIAVAAPTGGLGQFPALVKGDTGDAPTLDSIDFTALEYDDPTPDSATFTETSPDVYDLTLVLHKGEPGNDGDTVLDVNDFGYPTAGQILVVNTAVDDFEYQTQKVGDRYVPASIANTPSGNAVYTLCSVTVPAQDFDWRPEVAGQCVIDPTGSNTNVELIARLNNESSGNVVGRGFGLSSAGWGGDPQVVILSSCPPTASVDAYDKVEAGNAAVIYLRAERSSGSDTFTTSASTTNFCVRVNPVP